MIMPIICLFIIPVILCGLYVMYKDDNNTYHHYKEPKFDKEKAKKEIYNYLKEKYKNEKITSRRTRY